MDARRNPDPLEMPVTARQAEACHYRRQGYTFREIGQMMGITASSAYDHIATALRNEMAYRKATVEDVRQMELERLDAFQVIATKIAEDENSPVRQRLDAIRTALDISKRRSKLLGLDDAPCLADDTFITNTEQLIREIRERTKAARDRLTVQAMATLSSHEPSDDDPAVAPSFSLSN